MGEVSVSQEVVVAEGRYRKPCVFVNGFIMP